MTRNIRLLALSAIIVSALAACSFPNTTEAKVAQATPALPAVTTIELTVQADTSVPFNMVGQIVKFSYTIKNKGATGLPGTVSVTGATVICPNVNTIGNLDALFDVNETLICAGTYAITQADLDRGSVINVATASVNGTLSNQVTTTVATVQTKALTLTKTANPVTYDHLGQMITYAYSIKNSGIVALGPAQFTVTDIGIGAPINCGDANTSLAPNAMVACFATYVITQADLNAGAVTTNATASGGGAGPSQPVGVTITKGNVVQPVPPSDSATPVPGTTVQHLVVEGEWLWQIARCYGVDPNQLIADNPQIPVPSQIKAGTYVTVKNVGSAGTIYNKPCVVTYTVLAGDTWNSIAQKYNADPAVLQRVNPGPLTVGSVLKVPRNSASGTPVASDSIRISFAAGATSATVNGTALTGNRPSHYVLSASQGQVMTVKFTAPANSLSTAIYAPNGSMLKPLDLNLTWNGTLPSNGDYRMDVFNALGLGATDVPFTLEVSVTSTSNCTDLSRTLKTIGITHFNICGQTDANGNTRISVIHIFQRPEDVPQGGLLQDINISVETATPLGNPNGLVVEDMNYDGFDDFRIMEFLPAGPNVPYLYYLYVPATRQFVYSEAYAKITAPEFIGNFQIRSQWRKGADKWGIDTYTVANSIPTLTRREAWEALNETQATHRITVFNADGTSQVILEEVVAIPK